MKRLRGVVLARATMSGACGQVACAQESGVMEGRVLDALRGGPLTGALVRVEGTALSAATDDQGAFRLAGVPAGSRTVLVTYLGRTDVATAVEMTGGLVTIPDIRLEMGAAFQESVTVTGQSIQEGQARALNQQKTALNITNVVAAGQIGSWLPVRSVVDSRYASTQPVTGGDRYTQVLPGFHLRYALDTDTNVRAATRA